VQRYEHEIRQRHDAIEKKQVLVVRLNRKLDTILANRPVEEGTGPLEATIVHLNREVRKSILILGLASAILY